MNNPYDKDTLQMQDALGGGCVPEIVNQKLEAAYSQLKPISKAKRPFRKTWRNMLVVAALCCVLTVTTLAGEQIWTMMQGAVSFFDNKSQPTTIDSIKPSFEAMNANLNLSTEDKDITFTVQNVSIDNNFINVFGTVSKENLRDLVKNNNGNTSWAKDEVPDYWMLYFSSNVNPVAKINNELYGFDNALSDALNFYFIDDNTIAFAKRMLVKTQLPDSFTMEILANYSLTDGKEEQTLWGTNGNWTISTEIDLAAAKQQEKTIVPQIIAIGDKKLDLKKFSVSPLGAMAVVNDHIGDYMQDINGIPTQVNGPTDGFNSIASYGVRDSKGNWLYSMTPAGWGSEESLIEFTRPTAAADSITFVPIELVDEFPELKEKTMPLAIESKMELNSISGYTIKSYKIDGRHFEVVLMPYGPKCDTNMGHTLNLLLADGSTAYDESAHVASNNSTTDHLTGAITYTIDFYADQPKLANATQIKYYSLAEMTLNEANAVTVPLQ